MNALQGHNVNLKFLSEKYRLLTPKQRIKSFYEDFRHDDILVTSSFGTSSAILLHGIAQANPKQKIHFIDTTYLFEETHAYKEKLRKQLDLDVINISPEQWKNDFTRTDKTYQKDPDLCCSVNKVEPLARVKKGYKIWVSGLMAYQTPFRRSLELFEKSGDIIKFYPLIDVQPYFARGYYDKFNLPKHPLVAKGYSSVGCTHCTDIGENRSGRWQSSGKSECGLHVTK